MNENNRKNQNNNRTLKEKWEELQGFHKAVPILLIALAAFIVVCYCTEENGFLGQAIPMVFKGLFSIGAWAIPAMLVIHAIFYADDLERGRIPSRVIFSTVTTVMISMIEYAIAFSAGQADGNPVTYFVEQRAGGFIGSALAFLMVKIFAWWGLIIIAVAVFAIYVAYFYAGSNSTIGKVFFTVLEYIARFLAVIERWIIDLVGICKDAINEKRQRQIEDRHAELIDDDFFEVDNGMATMEIKELGIRESRNVEEIELNPTLHSKVHLKSAVKENIAQTKEAPKQEAAPQIKVDTHAKRAFNLDYSFDHLKADPSPVNEVQKADTAAEEKKKADRTSFGLDECAENVFTKDFDPFDFNTAEKIATRMSSKAPIREKIVPMYGEAVDIDNLTEEDVRRIREKEALAKKVAEERAIREQRLREFEARKAALIKNSANAQPAPQAQPTEKKTGYAPTFTDYSSHSAKEDIFAVKENKIIERRAAEIANSIDTSNDDSNATEAVDNVQIHNDAVAHVNADSYEEKKTSGFNQAYAKTVAFNVYSEVSHNPSENNSVQMTTQKYGDTAAATAAIADAVASKNPMYARSENVINGSFSYTVKIDPDEEIDTDEDIYESDDDLEPEIIEDDFDDAEEDTEDEVNTSFGDYNPIYDDEDSLDEEDVLNAERNVIEPSPESFVRSGSSNPTSYESEKCDSSDISATFSLVNSNDNEVQESETKDEFTWTPECAEPIHLLEDDEIDDAIDGFECEDAEEEDNTPEEIPLEEQNPDVIKQRSAFSFLRQEDEEKAKEAEASASAYQQQKVEDKRIDQSVSVNPMPATISTFAAVESKPLPPVPAEKEKKPAVSFANYVLPSVDLLATPPIDDYDYTAETQENANKLIEVLESFDITASIKGVDRGPRITRYEVVPARGVKVSAILNRQDDIALTLAAQSIRMEAPVPGKAAIGIELPNEKATTVYLKELVDTTEFRTSEHITTICLGKDVAGSPVFSNVESLPHLLVAGATGMGKSVCINACMLSMLFKAKPDELRFIMIDPKKVEFSRYNGIPHLLIPIVTENKQAAGALMWAVEEMNRRYELIGKMEVTNIDGYNKIVKGKPELGETLPRIVIVIDEFSDLMQSIKDPVEGLVLSLAQKARAAGIHLIIGTQRPDTSVITGTIKSNIPGRISCRVASYIDSKTVLDATGAEKLLNKGDMLYKSGAINVMRVQGAFVSDKEMIDVLSFIKAQSNGANYNEEVMDEILRAAQKCGKKSGGSSADDTRDGRGDSRNDSPLEDHEFLAAVDVALSQGQISTALLQRRLSIGFSKAARFIDYMEDMGIVSEKNGAKPRNVLISREEWIEKFNRVTI